VPKRKRITGPLARRPRVPTESLYGWRWSEFSRQFLREHPLCAACAAEGRSTFATQTDHVTPHRGDVVKFWNPDGGFQALCDECHGKKSATEDKPHGRKMRFEWDPMNTEGMP
jgi:5-methylcytosine-specific restriction endonuclease McrA